MTNRLPSVFLALVVSCMFAHIAAAEGLTKTGEPYAWKVFPPGERMLAGSERGATLALNGGTETLTSPVTIGKQINDEMHNYGALGFFTGTVRGTFKAATQALGGAAHVLIGSLDVVTSPMGGWE